jgi:streptogramin lyase
VGVDAGATCAIVCATNAYCDNGICKSRVTEFDVPTQSAGIGRITSGPDGNLWFVEGGARKIGRITPSGVIAEFDIPSAATRQPSGITAGPDGNVWFGELGGGVARITPNGTITEFLTPADSNPYAITAGADGNLWYASYTNHKIGIVTPAGVITELDQPSVADVPCIIRGPDGNVWFLESGVASPQIARVTPAGNFREFVIPTMYSNPQGLAVGADGNIWFTEASKIGRITTAGVITEFAAAGGGEMTTGPDGNIWYGSGQGHLERVSPSGTVTEYLVDAAPYGIATGSDGNIWFTDALTGLPRVGRFLTP